MSKVYTGKVMIPGDKIEEYFKIMAEAEKQREPFRQYLLKLNQEFSEYLESKYSTSPDQLMVALRKFFAFLAEVKGIVNDNVLKALQ